MMSITLQFSCPQAHSYTACYFNLHHSVHWLYSIMVYAIEYISILYNTIIVLLLNTLLVIVYYYYFVVNPFIVSIIGSYCYQYLMVSIVSY